MRLLKKIAIIEGIDYYINEKGFMVFTKEYHLKRGFCCKCGCLHCPFDYFLKKEILTKICSKKVKET